MMKRVRGLRQLFVELPRMLRLAYCLMRDPRVPVSVKAMFGGALVLIATPVVDIPAAIPVVGELDVVALTAIAVRAFIAACPRWVVEEQERLILERRSRFDDDVRRGERIAVMLYHRFRERNDGAAESAATGSTREAAG